jgi:hypothetical protein
MDKSSHDHRAEPVELGVASIATQGNGGPFAEKETTMLVGAISDD